MNKALEKLLEICERMGVVVLEFNLNDAHEETSAVIDENGKTSTVFYEDEGWHYC